MEASFVVPGPLDVAGTLSRFHLWGEDPAARSGLAPRLYGLQQFTMMTGEYVVWRSPRERSISTAWPGRPTLRSSSD